MNLKNPTHKRGLSTLSVHGGEERHGIAASLTTDIAQTSVFVLPKVMDLRRIVTGKAKGYFYTRNGNPTIAAAEAKIAGLEGGAGGVVTSSGMSAILAAVLATCEAGDEIVSMLDIYGGTTKLFESVLPGLGINTVLVPYADLNKIDSYCNKSTKLIFLESPTNPTLRSVDLRSMVRAAKKCRALVLMDNTFATPILQRPLDMGCDIVMHSATKYLGGHSDLTAGALVARDAKLVESMREMSVTTGGNFDPGAAYLLLRGMKTLEVRVERACKNAHQIVAALKKHKKVGRVMYPGLKSTEGHSIASRQMKDFGMMLSIELKSGGRSAERFIDRLRLWYLATSLGGVESTVSYPVLASHVNCSPQRLKLLDVSDATVRLSVGIENAVDLIEDLNQALNQA